MVRKINALPRHDLESGTSQDAEIKAGGKGSDDKLPEKFTTPELTEEQTAERQIKFRVDYDEALVWGEFVGDSKILESNDREQLKEYLDGLLDGLWERYGDNSTQFPLTGELTRLTEIVSRLANLVGVRKSDFGDLLGAMKRIENRWNKIQLITFADQLRDRLLKVPMSPASVVHHAWLECPASEHTRRQILREAKLVLTGEVNHDAKEFPWEKALAAIESLKFSGGKVGGDDLMPNNLVPQQKRRLSYLVLMDLRRQQMDWREKHAVDPSLAWLYLLQRSVDFEQLSRVYFGDALSPQAMQDVLATLANRDRRNRSYLKTKGKKTLKKAQKRGRSKK